MTDTIKFTSLATGYFYIALIPLAFSPPLPLPLSFWDAFKLIGNRLVLLGLDFKLCSVGPINIYSRANFAPLLKTH